MRKLITITVGVLMLVGCASENEYSMKEWSQKAESGIDLISEITDEVGNAALYGSNVEAASECRERLRDVTVAEGFLSGSPDRELRGILARMIHEMRASLEACVVMDWETATEHMENVSEAIIDWVDRMDGILAERSSRASQL